MNRFETLYKQLLEDLGGGNTSSAAWGTPAVAHSAFSGPNVYAPGDARLPSYLGAKLKKARKNKKLKIFMQRRKLMV